MNTWFDPDSLRALCSSNNWDRGAALYRGQRVLSMRIEALADRWQVSGEVQGTQREPYEVVVQLAFRHKGVLQSWQGLCTCPVGFQCKHAVALSLKAAYQGQRWLQTHGIAPAEMAAAPEPSPEERERLRAQRAEQERLQAEARLLDWLIALDSAELQPSQRGPRAAQGERRAPRIDQYLYLLSVQGRTSRRPLLRLEAVLSTPKVSGGWAKPRNIRTPPGPGNQAYDHASEADRQILQLLASVPQVSSYGHYYHYSGSLPSAVLEGRLSVMALEMAAGTGRLFAATETHELGMPLRWGPPRALDWAWQEVAPDKARTAAKAAPPDAAAEAATEAPAPRLWQLCARLAAPLQEVPAQEVPAQEVPPELPQAPGAATATAEQAAADMAAASSAPALPAPGAAVPSRSATPTPAASAGTTATAGTAAPRVWLCLNDPPLYLDLELGQTGLLQTDGFTPAQLELLLHAPALDERALRQQQNHLVQRLGRLPLPPVLPEIERVEGGAPQAWLTLAPTPPAERPVQGLITAQLQFDYQGHRGWWGLDGAPVLLDAPAADAAAADAADAAAAAKTRRILLVRQPEAERAAFARLQALGLLGTDAGRFYLPGPALQSTWLEWFEQDFAPLRAEGFALTLAPELAGWVRHADVLDVRMHPEGAGGAEDAGLHEGDDSTSPWFTLSLGMEIDGQRHNILPWLPDLIDAAAAHPPNPATGEPTLPPYVFLPMPGGEGFVRLPTEPLKPWMAALLELVGERGHDFAGDGLRLSRLEALRASAALGEGAQWQGAEALRALLQQLRGQAALPEVAVPASVQASLRPYQQQGLNWLQFLRAHGLAGILADDMGLGKTLQTLAHIQVEKDAGRLDRPALIVAPVSLLGNWQREAARFCPQLRSLVLHGKERHEVAQTLSEYDLVIAPYSILQRDRERWLQNRWHIVVLDEAHHIKNASTHAAQVVYALDTRHRLCLTGTPMENHLGEIWSLFHFLMPGFLGSQKRFTELYRTPIEKHGDAERLAQLRARITPFMLRRTKALVAHELPPKVETVLRVELSGAQANLYETIRLGMEKTVREALAAKGLAKSQITILDALLKLRQVCCDPRLVPLDAAKKVKTSAKLEQLMELLPEMLAEGRRILLFSQFTSMLTLVEQELHKHKLQWAKLTGQTRKRDEVIERFTRGEVPLFLISLKAGGVGLNLPQADTVIHYDPWWNPAVEAQATDRAHRIGQTQSVWVLKLVAQGTIEERILALQERKAELASSMYSGASARKEPLFTEDDLAELLRPLE